MVDGIPSATWDVPRLVLFRNGVLTDPVERTLSIKVTDIEVPPGGVIVTLILETQLGDPDVPGASPRRIEVGRETRRIENTSGATQAGISIAWNRERGTSVLLGVEMIATPTDHVGWELTVSGAVHGPAEPLYTASRDHAFLMENQWAVPLPQVAEASPGAAPDELIVYHADAGLGYESRGRSPSLE